MKWGRNSLNNVFKVITIDVCIKIIMNWKHYGYSL